MSLGRDVLLPAFKGLQGCRGRRVKWNFPDTGRVVLMRMANRGKKKTVFVWLAVLVVVVGGAAAVSLKALGRRPVKIDAEKIVKTERIDLARSVVATGKIEPVTKVEIKSKASGIIQSLPVNVGDLVRKGQIICELDKNDLLPRHREALAALAVAEAALKSAKADLERYQVEANGPDLPFLKRDMERARQMFKDLLIAQSARDEAEKNYELALNRQKSAVVNVGVARAAVAKAEAQLEQAKAVVARAEEDLRNATILSPIDGVVLSRDREMGDAVSSILTMGSGATLIMSLGDLSEVYVKGKVDESDIGKVYLGQPARITVESFKDQKFTGKVTKISPMGVEKDNVTTFEVRVSISNESRRLRALMTANAEIILEEHKGVLAVPEGALTYKKDRSTEVEVPDPSAENGRRRVAVVTGISNGAKTEILKGLSEGQQVILQ
jgi:HlyD family secretion protein